MVSGERRVSYAELARAVKSTASSLDLSPGDRVAIRLPNGIEFVQAFYAALAAGASVVPINTRLAPPEVEHILGDAKPAWVFADEEFPRGEGKDPQPQTNDECVVLYTSGTTGKPKGAVNTHANVIVQNVYQHAIAWGIGGGDVFLATTPLAHRAGVARLANALGLGGTLVAAPKFDAAAALESAMRTHLEEHARDHGLPPPEKVPCPVGMNDSSVIDAGDRRVQVLANMLHPRVVVFGGVLSEEECDAMVAMGRERLKPSSVFNPDTGADEAHEARSSRAAVQEKAGAARRAKASQTDNPGTKSPGAERTSRR